MIVYVFKCFPGNLLYTISSFEPWADRGDSVRSAVRPPRPNRAKSVAASGRGVTPYVSKLAGKFEERDKPEDVESLARELEARVLRPIRLRRSLRSGGGDDGAGPVVEVALAPQLLEEPLLLRPRVLRRRRGAIGGGGGGGEGGEEEDGNGGGGRDRVAARTEERGDEGTELGISHGKRRRRRRRRKKMAVRVLSAGEEGWGFLRQ
uniref:Uncharacterized protein n=1 Tax=Ananas comosus var. bracteatus TaxID=296719 RepID=A0A6V7PXF0_ANACO|nr:unnamed protein product [Ananas comosus var. bracteatus]